MLRASNQMNDFLESGRASRGGEGRESPQSSRKCLAKALSASSVSGGQTVRIIIIPVYSNMI